MQSITKVYTYFSNFFFIIWLIERNYKMHFTILKEYSTSNLDMNSSSKINQNICHAESIKRRKLIRNFSK